MSCCCCKCKPSESIITPPECSLCKKKVPSYSRGNFDRFLGSPLFGVSVISFTKICVRCSKKINDFFDEMEIK